MKGRFEFQAIGSFHSPRQAKLEAPRQGPNDQSGQVAEIHLLPGFNFEQALEDIEGFSHLWLIYVFHQNQSWKPKVRPPRGSKIQRGVFSTRSPYRPNPIGISACEFVRRDKKKLWVRCTDLLDGTPILDIKPYIAPTDSIPGATLGWHGDLAEAEYRIEESPVFSAQARWLENEGLTLLRSTVLQQLSRDPFNRKSKRVIALDPQGPWASGAGPTNFPRRGVFSYRTWRILFAVSEKQIELLEIRSGYRPDELADAGDPFGDKDLHRRFSK